MFIFIRVEKTEPKMFRLFSFVPRIISPFIQLRYATGASGDCAATCVKIKRKIVKLWVSVRKFKWNWICWNPSNWTIQKVLQSSTGFSPRSAYKMSLRRNIAVERQDEKEDVEIHFSNSSCVRSLNFLTLMM